MINGEGIEWTDRLTITVQATDLGDVYEDEFVMLIVEGGEAWPRKWLLDELRELGITANRDPRYNLKTSGSETSWGADASVAEILLSLGQDYFVLATMGAVSALVKKMRKLLQDRGAVASPPITHQEALAKTRYVVGTRYGTTSANLDEVSVDLQGDYKATVEVMDRSSGVRYEVGLDKAGGYVEDFRIKRTLPPSP